MVPEIPLLRYSLSRIKPVFWNIARYCVHDVNIVRVVQGQLVSCVTQKFKLGSIF